MQAPRPWLSSYATGVPADIDLPTESIAEPLYRAAASYGSHVALDFLGATTRYDELVGLVERAARVLLDAGVRSGDRVAIALPNCPQHVVAFYAIQRIGAIAVEINPTFTRAEIAHELADSGARVVVSWQRIAGTLLEANEGGVHTVFSADLVLALPRRLRLALQLPLERAKAKRAQLRGPRVGGVISWERAVAAAQPLASSHPWPAPSDVAALLYTSGTSGPPRAAMLTHSNLLSVSAMGEAWVPQLRPGHETFIAALPFFHSFGMQLCLLFAIRMGARVSLFPSFDPAQLLEAQRRSKATFFPGVPAMFERTARAAKQRGVDLSSIQIAISGAMALPAETAAQWEEITGGIVVEGYGLTETAPIVLGNPIDRTRRPGYCGLPFPSTEIRVVSQDDPARQVATGEIGELLVRGPQVTPGYWNRPEETKAAKIEGGWWRTGDIVTQDEAGFVRLVDRSKEIIITGGYNVYPSQVEELVRQLPQVADVAVVGLPAEGAMGERVVAAIVLAKDAAEVSLEQLREWCAEHLARYALPREVVVVEELPYSQIGKVLRRVVREQLLHRTKATA